MKYLVLIFILFINFPANSQAEVNYWDLLSDVKFESRMQDGYEIEFPIFGERATKLDENVIRLKGYIVPLENLRGSNYFMLSSLPFNVCFFCGGAGPETVIEVHTKETVDFSDEAIVVEGKLTLNRTDPDHHMYIINDAQIIGN